MSFDFSPMQNLTNVQASHKSTPGGGGNTGYFKRGKKDEEEQNVGWSKDYPNDSFEQDTITEETEEQSLIETIKAFFIDLFESIKEFFKGNTDKKDPL